MEKNGARITNNKSGEFSKCTINRSGKQLCPRMRCKHVMMKKVVMTKTMRWYYNHIISLIIILCHVQSRHFIQLHSQHELQRMIVEDGVPHHKFTAPSTPTIMIKLVLETTEV